MDYIGLKCPVCKNNFHIGDDIVVCPECGTPHHRECYEKENKCYYDEKHVQGFLYEDFLSEQVSEEIPGAIICQNCKSPNPEGTFFCRRCGNPLAAEKNTQNTKIYNKDESTVNINGTSYNMGNGEFAFDPMGGINPNEQIADNITAGEMAKFVKSNTPYFLRVFSNIKNYSKSRFNFAGFLFFGGYFLYRKQYIFGTLITLLYAALWIPAMLISYSEQYVQLLNGLSNNSYSFMDMSSTELLYILIPFVLQSFCLALRIVCGFIANKRYYKYCIKKINTIKENAKTETDAELGIQNKGGVNSAVILFIFVLYIALVYVPALL